MTSQEEQGEKTRRERNRIDRVTTGRGDDGETALADGRRVRKYSPRMELLGTLDEANSWLGLLATETDADASEKLQDIQSCLFDAGAIVAGGQSAVDWQGLVADMEAATATLNATLPPLQEFLLPGGSRAAAIAHVARTTVRRAERAWWCVVDEDASLRQCKAALGSGSYLNRLSDYLFVYARTLADSERLWRGPTRTASAVTTPSAADPPAP